MKNFHITGYYGWEKDLGLRSSYFPKPQDPRKLEGSDADDADDTGSFSSCK